MNVKLRGILRALPIAMLFASSMLTPLARATEVAPYFMGWAINGGYSTSTLMDAKSKGGVTAVTLAFGIADKNLAGCTLRGGLHHFLSGPGKTDISNFQAAGGRVILGFGGAGDVNSIYLEKKCSENDMYNVIKNALDITQARAIDFDVEGSALNTDDLASRTAASAKRNNVVKRLQVQYPSLYVSYTLPVSPSGLGSNGLEVVKSAKAAGVKVSLVNIMAMNYYEGDQSRSMGQLAIAAASNTFTQLKAVFTDKSDAQLWSMIGVTPMIGVNDWRGPSWTKDQVFRQSDATELVTFAQQKGLGLLSMWALQRDRPGNTNVHAFSLVNNSAYEFYNIFAKVKATVCANSTEWNNSIRYMPGDVVTRNGQRYIATAASADSTWNLNAAPEYTPSLWATYTCSSTCLSFPDWNANMRYMPGNTVTRNGQRYVASAASADPTWNLNAAPEYTPSLWAVFALEWNNNIRYVPGDVVTRNGQGYVATAASAAPTWNLNAAPEYTPRLWSTYNCTN